MNKEEYLHQLEQHLKKYISKTELQDILMDYGEYFEDGRRQNKSDTEISAKLGPPEIIAQQFIEEVKPLPSKTSKEELDKLREKAAIGMQSVKRKLTLPKNCAYSFKPKNTSTFTSACNSIYDGIKNIVEFFIKCLLFFISLLLIGILTLFAISFLGILLSGVVFCIITGVCGMIFFAVSFQFISIFFTIAGIFGSIVVLCIGLLLGLFFIFLIHCIFHMIKSLFQLMLKKTGKKEAINRE